MRRHNKLGAFCLVIGLMGAVQAAEDPVDSYFRGQELSLDIFGNYALGESTLEDLDRDNIKDGRLGVGLGANYFVTRNFGFGVDGYLGDFDDIMDHLSVSVIARYPFDVPGIAPYVFGGGGRQWDPATQYTGHLGAGFEVRWSPNMGFFSDARFVWADKTDEFGLVRWGLRFAF
ncbi:MAG: hypothetical protein AB1813_03155 [Verrucomicrobiota bacterium]|jgi:hypothetical protein